MRAKSILNMASLHELYEFLLPVERRWFGIFVLLSALVHLALLVFLPILSIRPEKIFRPPSEVTIAIFSHDFDNWLGGGKIWLDIRDPKLLSQPIADLKVPQNLERLEGMSALSRPEMTWADLSEEIAYASRFSTIPSPQDRAYEGILELKPQPDPIKVEAPPAIRGTGITVIGELSQRQILNKVEIPKSESSQAHGLTVVLLGVNSEGVVEFSSVDKSSGNDELEQQARRILDRWLFEEVSDEQQLMWGRVLIAWDFLEATKNPKSKAIVK